jgi:hypothetical protein
MNDASEMIIAGLDLSALPEGEIIRALEPLSDAEKVFLRTWETPLAPWGGFKEKSRIDVIATDGGKALRFTDKQDGAYEHAIVTGGEALRDCRITAVVEPRATESCPFVDDTNCHEAHVGIVFRMVTLRWYYQFGIEGRKRVVLYRRRDDEWYPLASRDVTLPDGPVTLIVDTDGDGIHCECPECDVEFHVTDEMFKAGKVGYRSLNESVLHDLNVTAVPWQLKRNAQRAAKLGTELRERGAEVPDAVLVKTLDLAKIGGTPRFLDFAVPGRFDMLVASGNELRALTADGEEMWRHGESVNMMTFSTGHDGEHGRLIYGFTGQRKVVNRDNVDGRTTATMLHDEMLVIRGSDGEVLARARLPEEVGDMRCYDWSPGSARLQNADGFDVVLREWRDDLEGGGRRLWALDRNLNELWHAEQDGSHYGHHGALAFHDIDGDGYDELLAGGYMYRGDGSLIWYHDRADEMWEISGARHYDAVALGDMAGDPDVDPTAFLIGGSGGVYVVDALTGHTRAVHRIGHAQGCFLCNLRDDLPGRQLLAVTRWGNFGIITLFAGDGTRLWTIQPDYVGQGCLEVDWAGRKLLWTNTSRDAQALYDGYGQRVKALPAISMIYGDHPRMRVITSVIHMGNDPREYLALGCDQKLHIFGPVE